MTGQNNNPYFDLCKLTYRSRLERLRQVVVAASETQDFSNFFYVSWIFLTVYLLICDEKG